MLFWESKPVAFCSEIEVWTLALTSTSVARNEERINRFHWKIELFGGLYQLLASLDLGILSFALAQLVGIWGLTPFQIGVIAVVAAAGTLVGGVLFGHTADSIGRRSTLQLSLLVTAIGTALGAVSWDYISLSVFQFIAGVGIGGVAPIVGAFVGEFAPAKHRGRLSSMLELFWISGLLLAALGSLFILPGFGWRIAFVFGALPLIWVVVQKRFVPESPRYLISRGRHDEARQFLSRVKENYGLSYDHLMVNEAVHERKGILASLGELWSGPLMRRTATTWLLWFVLVYSYYGIFVWLPTLLATNGLGIMKSIEYMLVFTSVQLPAIAVTAFLVDMIGRKGVLVPALFLCGVSSYMFGKAGSPTDVLIWGSIVSLTNIVGWGVMLGYTAELFPTRVRGTGVGAASAFGRLGQVFVPGVMALLIGSWTSGYQMVFMMFAAILIVGGVGIAILGEETKGRSLEDISG